jgi:hypothetical protein
MNFKREHCKYSPLFCEENIWWLAANMMESGINEQDLKVLFFSNPHKSILMLNQRAAEKGNLVLWDYHVVLLVDIDQQVDVFDFDTRLSFPSDLKTYMLNSFPDQASLLQQYRSWVRTIPVASFIVHFYSDRSHMLNKITISEMPDYPPIKPVAGIHQIDISDYWDMNKPLEGCKVESIESFYSNRNLT